MFEYDPDNESVTIFIGDGDLSIGCSKGTVTIADIGQKCDVGQDLSSCLKGVDYNDRFVRLRGSYKGLRVFLAALMQAVWESSPDPAAELPDGVKFCATCGGVGRLRDTGLYMICDRCLGVLVDPKKEIENEGNGLGEHSKGDGPDGHSEKTP